MWEVDIWEQNSFQHPAAAGATGLSRDGRRAAPVAAHRVGDRRAPPPAAGAHEGQFHSATTAFPTASGYGRRLRYNGTHRARKLMSNINYRLQ